MTREQILASDPMKAAGARAVDLAEADANRAEAVRAAVDRETRRNRAVRAEADRRTAEAAAIRAAVTDAPAL